MTTPDTEPATPGGPYVELYAQRANERLTVLEGRLGETHEHAPTLTVEGRLAGIYNRLDRIEKDARAWQVGHHGAHEANAERLGDLEARVSRMDKEQHETTSGIYAVVGLVPHEVAPLGATVAGLDDRLDGLNEDVKRLRGEVADHLTQHQLVDEGMPDDHPAEPDVLAEALAPLRQRLTLMRNVLDTHPLPQATLAHHLASALAMVEELSNPDSDAAHWAPPPNDDLADAATSDELAEAHMAEIARTLGPSAESPQARKAMNDAMRADAAEYTAAVAAMTPVDGVVMHIHLDGGYTTACQLNERGMCTLPLHIHTARHRCQLEPAPRYPETSSAAVIYRCVLRWPDGCGCTNESVSATSTVPAIHTLHPQPVDGGPPNGGNPS